MLYWLYLYRLFGMHYLYISPVLARLCWQHVSDSQWWVVECGARQRVSESLFWEALPMTELLEECEMRGVSISDTQHQSDEDARRQNAFKNTRSTWCFVQMCSFPVGHRRSLVRKLVKESCLRAWVSWLRAFTRINQKGCTGSFVSRGKGYRA